MTPFTWPVRVYWEDTDAGGIVFYANYLKFFERARTEWLRSLGVMQGSLRASERGMFVVSETSVRYLAPARLDDELLVTARLEAAGRASLIIAQQALRGGTLLAEGTIRIGWVDDQALRPGRIPAAILDVLNQAIDAPDEMAPTAPRVISVNIPVDKIGEVIGPKGKVINQIQDDTGAQISIEDNGTVYIGAVDGPSAEAARAAINAIANPTNPEVGERYLGTVVKIASFGAFVSLLPGRDGLLHVTAMRPLNDGKRIEAVEDVVSVGQKLQVTITKVDDRGKLSLELVEDESAAAPTEDAPAAE